MTRNAEGVMIVIAATLAAFGVTLVNFARGDNVDAQSGLTFLVFLIAFGGLHLAVRRWVPKASPLLLAPIAALTALGFIEIYRLDPQRAGLQRWWLLIGAGVASLLIAFLSSVTIPWLRRYRNVTLLVSLGLLLLPNLPQDWGFPLRGLELNGSRLWVVLDLEVTRLHFQPAELAKLGLVVFIAAYLADHQRSLREARRVIGGIQFPEPRQLTPLVLAWGASVAVLIWQRDLGASLLLFAAFVLLLYAATGTAGYLVTGGLLTILGGVLSFLFFDHVERRVTGWLSPFENYEDQGYQIAQGLFAMGSGSLTGSGPALGRPDLIPNAETDFIFAAVAEELGLAGSVAIIALFALLVAVGLGIAFRSRDTFRKLLAAGLTLVLGTQAFLIIGGILRIVPLTGITLPFMSYGGSALVGNFLLIGMLLTLSHEEAP
ncbi:MAG: FtsW/RodA/SpoVE family cell cycle protein [Acidimicrobiia bacterium]|nr:FtsW/RodA/SpoVE family cell cycle protein [Acidimicrobiia bacterium]